MANGFYFPFQLLEASGCHFKAKRPASLPGRVLNAPKIQSMRVHQLNIRYDNEQDRLLTRINTDTGQEFRLWLTRRLVLGLLPLLRRLVAEHDERDAAAQNEASPAPDRQVRQLLGEFKKDQLLQQADFRPPFKEPPPEAERTLPLLVGEVVVNALASGNLQAVFRGLQGDTPPREIRLELDSQLMHGFMHLLELAFTASEWSRVSVAAFEVDGNPATAAPSARPQYLN
jgi:hypothetical protein